MIAPLDAPGLFKEPSATDAEEDPVVKEIESAGSSGARVMSSRGGYSSSIANQQAVRVLTFQSLRAFLSDHIRF